MSGESTEIAIATASGTEKISDTRPMPVKQMARSSVGKASTAIVTRPANQTPYGALDIVGAAAAAITFTGVGGAGEWTINSSELRIDTASVPAGQTSYTLHLFNVTPPSALADNAPFALSAPDAAVYLGAMTLGTPVDQGPLLYVNTNAIGKQLTLASADVFGYLVTVGAFTANENSTVYTITLHATPA